MTISPKLSKAKLGIMLMGFSNSSGPLACSHFAMDMRSVHTPMVSIPHSGRLQLSLLI
jgi:hypothetical protein